MNDEISQEAKIALANGHRRRALERLHRDGAESRPAMQRRIRALAAERAIPPADYAKLLWKRPSPGAVLTFCEKYDVNLDWLLCGDLKGLQRMRRDHGQRSCVPTRAEPFMEKYHRLSPQVQKIIEATVDRLLKERR